MTEREEEQPEIRVTDRRKFNLDGSLREGVEIVPEKPKEQAAADLPQSEILTSASRAEPSETPLITNSSGEISEPDEADFDDEDIPGADDPASFVNFLSTLVTNAAASLGAMPHPVTGQRTVDLETGKFWIDVMVMLREKTKGNLLAKESQLLEGILGDLQMQYVQLVRATEEKLKQEAAKKFSASDILGKK
ncbi:MAG: DUF1844 domain-containing protein [Pyrinomonadaceae bacterium]